jgi:hypothetical protein
MAVPTVSADGARRRVRVQGMPVRRWLTTTPGRLRVASIALVAGLIVVAVVAVSATSARHDAAEAVGLQTVPALIEAQSLFASLADADATASVIYLKAGLESSELRARYKADLASAGKHLAAVARAADLSPDAQTAVRTITEQLPVYTELVGEARFNSRQGFPVGARYLHDASTLMRDEILPAATAIYADASRQLDDNFESGTSGAEVALVVLAAGALVVLLVGVQFFVGRRTRRIFNVALVGATLLVLVLLIGALAQYTSSRDALARAQQEGSDTVQLLAAARILTLRASADESFALIERGTGQAFLDDFDVVATRVAGEEGNGGLLARAKDGAVSDATDGIQAVQAGFTDFRATDARVRAADESGSYQDAVALSTGDQVTKVRNLDDAYRSEIGAARARLEQHATDARSGFDVLAIGIPLLLLAAAGLVLLGLERRIAEYR